MFLLVCQVAIYPVVFYAVQKLDNILYFMCKFINHLFLITDFFLSLLYSSFLKVGQLAIFSAEALSRLSMQRFWPQTCSTISPMLHILYISFSFVLFLTMFCGVLACFSVPACSGMFPLSRKFCCGPVSQVFVLTILVRYLMLPKRYKYLYKTFKSTLCPYVKETSGKQNYYSS